MLGTMDDETTTEYLHRVMPLCATLGMRVDAFTADAVVLSLDWSAALSTSGGLLHGGTIMALADSAGGACAFLNLPDGAAGTSTIESKTNFLGAVTSGTVTATATPLHRGTTTIVIETSVRDERDRLVAKVTQTQAVLRPR
jgi:1,4-dihydroxy-2-naphthoyl-CoA hydrolase